MLETKANAKMARGSLYIGIIALSMAALPIIIRGLFRSPPFMVFIPLALVLSIVGLVISIKSLNSLYKNTAKIGMILCIIALSVIGALILFIGAIIIFYPKI